MQMINAINTLSLLSELIEDAQTIVKHLETLREQLTDDDFEAIYNSPLDALVCSCIDLEHTLEQLS